MSVVFAHGDRLYEVEVTPLGGDRYRVSVDGTALETTVDVRGDALELRGTGWVVRAWVTRDGGRRFVTAPGVGDAVLERVEARRGARRASGAGGAGGLSSPMPGRVVKRLVDPGAMVAKGATLLVVEAMKTELAIVAPRDGRVTRVDATVGAMVEAGKPLVELE